ncbi:hypothetical protein CR513_00908, partial [Mucuna pruriens]
MPNKVLNFDTPLDVLHKCFPTNRLSSSLPLKIFDCIVFVHTHNHNKRKLEPRAKKCVFVLYAPNQKNFKCFELISKKISCTQHPLYKYVSYENLSPAFRVFTSHLSILEIPNTLQDVLRIPKWKETIFEEMKALEKMALLVKGFTQTYDINYSETFSLIAKLNIQVLLSLVANLDWSLQQLDVKKCIPQW